MPRTSYRPLAALLGLTLAAGVTVTTGPTTAAGPAPGAPQPPKTPTSVGYGGAVSSVDPYASKVGLDVLKRGGNAADAAVAMASALGVTEPYSAGVGGGGYFVYYDAKSGKVQTLDGRETAPAAMPTRTRSSTRRPASRTASPRSWSPAASRSAPRAPRPPGTPPWTAGGAGR